MDCQHITIINYVVFIWFGEFPPNLNDPIQFYDNYEARATRQVTLTTIFTEAICQMFV